MANLSSTASRLRRATRPLPAPRLGFRPALALLALALFTGGCGDTDLPEDEGLPSEVEVPAPLEQAPSPMDTMIHATIALASTEGSGVSGEAMAMHSDDAVVIILELEGLPSEGPYPAHIHQGRCAEGGPVVVPLNPVAGLADGTGTSTTTLEAHEVGTDTPHFIMIRGEGGTSLACGDLAGHGDPPAPGDEGAPRDAPGSR